MGKLLVPRGEGPTKKRNIGLTQVSGWGGDSGGITSAYRQPWDPQKAVREGFAKESLLAKITTAVGEDCAKRTKFPFIAVQTGTGKELTDHPVPWHWNVAANEQMAASTLLSYISLALDFAGESFVVRVGEAWAPLIAPKIEVLGAKRGSTNSDGTPALVGGYVIRNQMGQELGRYDAYGNPISGMAVGVLHHIFNPYPENAYRVSPYVEQVGLSVDISYYSRMAVKSLMKNSGQPAGVIQLGDDEEWNQEQLDDVERKINSRLSDVTQKGRTLVINSKMSYQQLGQGAAGAGWNDLALEERKMMLGGWYMPASRLGMGGDSTFENQKTSRAGYYEDMILARLGLIASCLNVRFRQEGFELVVDDSLVRELLIDDASVSRATKLWQVGLATKNEAREIVSLPPIDGGDDFTEIPVAVQDAPAANKAPGTKSRDAVPLAKRATGPLPPDEQAAVWDAYVEGNRGLPRAAQAHHQWVYDQCIYQLTRVAGLHHRDDPAVSPQDLPTPNVPPEILFTIKEANDKLEALIGPEEWKAIEDAIAEGAGTLGTTLDKNATVWQHMLTQRIARLVHGKAPDGTELFKPWNVDLRDDVAKVLSEGYSQGFTVGKTGTALQGVLGIETPKGKVGWRAEAIARTELNGIASAVTDQAMQEAGVTMKWWYSASDERTRPSHSKAAQDYPQSKAIPMESSFTVGGTRMLRPHDPYAPASEVMGCRCRLMAAVDLSTI